MNILKIILLIIIISVPIGMMILSLSFLASSVRMYKSQVTFIKRIFKLLNIDDSIYDELEKDSYINLDGSSKTSWY